MKHKLLITILAVVSVALIPLIILLFSSSLVVDRNIAYSAICDVTFIDKNSTSYKIEIVKCAGKESGLSKARYFGDQLPPKSVITIIDYYNSLGNTTVGETYRLIGITTPGSGKFSPLPASIIPRQGDLLEAFKNIAG